MGELTLTDEVWMAVGRFVMTEHVIDAMIAEYTSRLPAALVKHLIRPAVRNVERRACLAAMLDDKGLTGGYPDLVAVFAAVAKRRNELAHAFVTASEDGGLQLVRFDMTAQSQWYERWSPAEVQQFLADALRLRGLTVTLAIEVGLAAGGKNEKGLVRGQDAIGYYAPDEPRPPFAHRRRRHQ